ncbi:hypothetical protein CHS0354_000995 [Potamilus streckersoni]|uniref:glutathione transferase n=1 Tax=Potamilus streckersoni TaxID=2493646 RepID=A0AAE0WBP9_9BIVA|nr:hypothetical protein CHS0354_000995 [Potamilus streckersoni]
MPEYRLHYFNGRGAAEPARLLFALADVKYEDVRYEKVAWIAKKREMPHGALPVLEIDGNMMTQSQAIIRYLAMEYGFHGSNNMEIFQIDEIHEAVVELQRDLYDARFETDEERKKEILDTLQLRIIPSFMTFIEMRLAENEGDKGHFIHDRITLADVLIYNIIFNIEQFTNVETYKWPRLKAVYNKMETDPKIVAWLEKRPLTDY